MNSHKLMAFLAAEKTKCALAMLFLLSLVLILFRPVLTSSDQIVHGGDLIAVYPQRAFAAEIIKNKQLPFWNPYVFSGYPFLAMPHQANVFYPPNFLFLLLPTNLAINYSIVLHIFFAGLFMYLYLKAEGVTHFGSCVSGMAFMFSSYFLGQVYAGHTTQLYTAIWTPLAFLLLCRMMSTRQVKYCALLGVCLAFPIFAGHQQIVAYAIVALTLYLVYHSFAAWPGVKTFSKKALFFGLALVIALGLSSVQLFPLLELVQRIARFQVSLDFAIAGSMPPYNPITFLAPDMLGNPMTHTSIRGSGYWEMCGYIGVFPLLLGLMAVIFKRTRTVVFFAGLALLAIVLALGRYTPVYAVLLHVLPKFEIVGTPGRALYLYTFSMAVLAGFGADFLVGVTEQAKSRKLSNLSRVLIILCLGSLVVLVGYYVGRDHVLSVGEQLIRSFYSKGRSVSPDFHIRKLGVLYAVQLKSLLVFTLLFFSSSALVILQLHKKIDSRVLKPLLLLIVSVDLYASGAQLIFPVDLSTYAGSNYGADFLHNDKSLYRVIPPEGEWNKGSLYQAFEVTGYDPLILERYAEFLGLIENKPISSFDPRLIRVTNFSSPLLDLLNVKYVITRDRIDYDTLELVHTEKGGFIYENADYLPRAFVVYEGRVIDDESKILEELGSPSFDPRKEVILERDDIGQGVTASSTNEARVQITAYSPNKIDISARLPQTGYMVLSEIFYPGWRAYVDGQRVEIYRADYILRAVRLEKGDHRVEFVFDSTVFKIGVGVTTMTAIALALIIACSAWRGRGKIAQESQGK